MKRMASAVLALSLVISLYGCGGGDSSDRGEPSSSGSSVSSAAEQSSQQENTEAEPRAAAELKALNVNGTVGSIQPAGDGKAVLQYLTTENETLCSFAAMIDSSSDTLIASGRLGSISEKLVGVLSDGGVVTFDTDEGALVFYKSDMSFDKKAALPEGVTKVVLSKSDDTIYAVSLNKLIKVNSDGSTEEAAVLSDNAVISQFDPETGLILYFELTEGEGSAKSFLCNVADTDNVTEISADNESCYFQNGRLIVRGSRVYPGSVDSGSVLEQKALLTAYDDSFSPIDTYKLAGWTTVINSFLKNGECLIAAEAVEVINKEYPHLKAKLDYMAEKMKTSMGVVSWPDSSAD